MNNTEQVTAVLISYQPCRSDMGNGVNAVEHCAAADTLSCCLYHCALVCRRV